LRSSASSRTSIDSRRPAAPGSEARRSLRHEAVFAGLIAAFVSVVAFGYCYQNNLLLLYGDAVAHLAIARRILDSTSPGIRQIGSVWLPFPHLLIMPFAAKMSWWQSGIAGAIPSMACYVLSVAGLWRLARFWLRPAGAVVAVLFFALNPGLLYMQTTAMTEPLFLCQIVWSALFLVAFLRELQVAPPTVPGVALKGHSFREPVLSDAKPDQAEDTDSRHRALKGHGFSRADKPAQERGASAPERSFSGNPDQDLSHRANGPSPGRALIACGLVLVTAVFTRYDGWIFTCLVWLVALRGLWNARAWKSRAGGAFVLFTAMLATAPVLWFAWNARQYGDWLDFMRGPYSAKAIAIRTTPPGAYHWPGFHKPWVAFLYFLKVAELGVAPHYFTDVILILAVTGTVLALLRWRGQSILPLLLLWMPVPFYAYAVSYGWVPIFFPLWFPHSWYNTRYGMEMLPGFALGLGFLAAWLIARAEIRWHRHAQLILLASIVLILADSAFLTHSTPLVLGEAIANARTRVPFEAAYARALDQLPPHGKILVWTSDHPGAFERAGIPLRRTINETDYYRWTPALQHPAQSAAFVIAADHDAVAKAVAAHPQGLTLIDIVCSTGQPCVRFYRSDLAPKR